MENSAYNFFFGRILSEFWYYMRILYPTDIIVYTYVYVEIKVVLRILFSQQTFVGILESQQNFA